MKIVQKLPPSARYDYTDIFGHRIYHTARRRYDVNPKLKIVKSEKND